VPWEQLLILSPSHARLLADGGLSKQDIRNYVWEKARITMAEVEAEGRHVGVEMDPRPIVGDRSVLVPMTERPEELAIIVAGGAGGSVSTFVSCMVGRVTDKISERLPPRRE